MTLNEFIDKWLGKKCDYDNFYGGQCVDLYRMYVKEVLGFPQSPGVGGAAEIWDTADHKYYDFITNEPTAVPQRGDIVIWNRKAGGGFGHVAVFLEGDVNKFTSLDQNWPTLDKVTKTEHDYKNVIGWLRPKKQDNIEPDVIAQLQNRIKDLEKEVEERKARQGETEIELKAANEKYTRDMQFLADKVQTTDDVNVIGVAIDKLLVAEDGLQKCLDDKRECGEKRQELAAEYEKTLEELSLDSGVAVKSSAGVKRALAAYLKLHPQEIVGDIKDYQNILKLFGLLIYRR